MTMLDYLILKIKAKTLAWLIYLVQRLAKLWGWNIVFFVDDE